MGTGDELFDVKAWAMAGSLLAHGCKLASKIACTIFSFSTSEKLRHAVPRSMCRAAFVLKSSINALPPNGLLAVF
ncbi:MAG TPA: hypothetical protein DEF45_21950 [Rhodopirellula sp.]|nr:hypothetical protein [Rhodopirellula sp.]